MEEDFSKVEEQFTMARVYANKTKTIVESLTQEQRKQTGTVLNFDQTSCYRTRSHAKQRDVT